MLAERGVTLSAVCPDQRQTTTGSDQATAPVVTRDPEPSHRRQAPCRPTEDGRLQGRGYSDRNDLQEVIEPGKIAGVASVEPG